ncbi:MAG: UDP-N-acetylmuramate dehydrogenase [Planctomycetes bacterium]|nr:UDP-N-acetylmuramate dehydrogenase [Planctomycetota bacterium]
MSSLETFSEHLKKDEPLAPYTWLKVGGPAQYFLEPRSLDELIRAVKICYEEGITVRVLGGGSNLLVRDEGVSGLVLRLSDPCFCGIEIADARVSVGGGALLSRVVSETVRAGLAGFESLAGIPGTIGGALHGNAGGHHGDIAQFVKSVRVLSPAGEISARKEDDLSFDYRQSNLDELLVLDAVFELQKDDPDQISQRLRKIWISKKASQPLSLQTAGCIFRNPRGQRAGQLIEQAGLKGTRIGGAEINDRHANFIVTHDGASSSDVLRVMDLVRSKVAEQFGVALVPEVKIW